MIFVPDFIVDDTGSFGKVTINIAEQLVARSDIVVKACYYPSKQGLPKGAQLRLELPHAWMPVQIKDPEKAGYVSVDSFIPVEIWRSLSNLVVYAEIKETLAPTENITIIYNDHDKMFYRPVVAQTAYIDHQYYCFYVRNSSKDRWKMIYQGRLKIIGGKAESLMLRLPAITRGETVDLIIAAKDYWKNISEDYRGKVRLYYPPGLTGPEWIDFIPSDRGYKIIERAISVTGKHIPDTDIKDLPQKHKSWGQYPRPAEVGNIYRISAEAPSGLTGVSNPMLYDPGASNSIYFGDTHVHTREFSDGCGTGHDAYYYMKYVSALDFGALADHTQQKIHSTLGVQRGIEMGEEGWRQVIELAEKESEAGRFVGIPGYEWSGRKGYCQDFPYEVMSDKVILFGSYDKANPIIRYKEGFDNTPSKLYSAIDGYDAVVISHTTASWTMGSAWEEVDNKWEPVVEIASWHGFSEGIDSEEPLVTYRDAGSVRNALKSGFKLGFIGSGDDHLGHPGWIGNPYEEYPIFSHRSRPGIAAVITDNFTLSGILDALRKRHCYATTGALIYLDVKAHGGIMGDEIAIRENPTITATVCGTAELTKLDVVKDGEVVKVIGAYGSDRIKFAYRDEEAKTGETHFYYIRARQGDGQWAWSSPIWLSIREE